jgi:N-acetylglucosaminyl-diphospho-decaprenol L-rhamnosyltransferase
MDVDAPPQLDVAIVAYRCESLLRDCLASLRSHPPARPMRVHVVDNASGDGTAEMVAGEFPEAVLTASALNLGFSAANNIVIESGSAPYVLALNPDTQVTEGALETMLELMDARPEVGISGPRLELEDGSFDHAAKRSFPTPLSALGHFTGIGRRNRASGALAGYRAPETPESQAGPVDAVNGAFMLIRRQALEEAGSFDEGYWMYMEDLDLCYRFAEAGWTTYYEPGATVIHVKAGTSGKARSWKLNRAFHYGMYRFYREHYAPRRNPVVNGSVYAGIAGKLAISAARSAWARRGPRSAAAGAPAKTGPAS